MFNRNFSHSYRTASLLVWVITSALSAADYQWSGSGGGGWNNPASWTPQGVPGAEDRAVIPSGSPVLMGNGTVGHLELNGGNLTVNGTLAVTGTFRWSGGTLSGVDGTTVIGSGAVLTFPATGSQAIAAGHRLLNTASGRIHARAGDGAQFTVSGLGLVENHGEVVVDAGVALRLPGRFLMGGGVVKAEGELVIPGGRFEFNGGRLEGTVRAFNSIIHVAETVSEPSTLRVSGPGCRLEASASPAVTLWVEARNADFGHAFLAVPNSITNHGTLLLQNTGTDGYSGRLDLGAGVVLVNAAGAVLRANAPASGASTIVGAGRIENRGTVSAGAGTTLVVPTEFIQLDGQVRGEGSVVFQGLFDFRGGWLTGMVRANNASIRIADTVTVPSVLSVVGTTGRLLANASPAVTLRVEATSGNLYGHAFLAIPDSTFNRGTIVLQATSADGYSSRLDLRAGTVLTNAPGAVIRAEKGAAGTTGIQGAGRLDNSGTVTAGIDSLLTIATDFKQLGGQVRGDGRLVIDGKVFEFHGGRLEGMVRALNARVWVGETVGETSMLRMVGTSGILTGNASPAVTIAIEATSGGEHGHAFVSATGSLVNRGTILLRNTSADGYSSRLTLGPDVVLENGSTGVLRSESGPAGTTTVLGPGRIENRGTILAGLGSLLSVGADVHQLAGLARGDGELLFQGVGLEIHGGRLEGRVRAMNPRLLVAATVTEPSTLRVVGTSGVLRANDSPAFTVWLEGGGIPLHGHAILTITNSLVHRGILRMESTGTPGYITQLQVGAGLEFINGPDGVIRVEPGVGSPTQIAGQGRMLNRGRFELNGANVAFTTVSWFNEVEGVFTGTGIVSANTGIFENRGVVQPGPLAGELRFNGEYRQSSGGRLDLDLAGPSAGIGHDRLVVQGRAVLDGTMTVRVADDFDPAIGDRFQPVTWTTRTGEFQGIEGLRYQTHRVLQATYLANELELLTADAAGQPIIPPTVARQPLSQTVINGQAVTFEVTANGTRPLEYQWHRNATPIPDAIGRLFTIPQARTNDSGGYTVVVSNPGGSVTSIVASLIVRPIADLVITDLGHPVEVIAGEPVTLTWRSFNRGSQSATAPWTESIALSTQPSGSPRFEIATVEAGSNLTAGESILRTQSVVFPPGLDGPHYLVISIDARDQVVEEAGEDNNVVVGTQPIRVMAPDLRIQDLSLRSDVDAPSSAAELGGSLVVAWNSTNGGSAAVQVPWSERVHLSRQPDSLSGALPLATLDLTSVPLPAGGMVSNRVAITLPLTAAFPPGDYWILVTTDAGRAVAESVETNNLASIPVTLSHPPLPDLAVVEFTAPANATPGQLLSLNWTVTNRGTRAIEGVWTETVMLAGDPSGVDALELGSFIRTNTIPAGGSLNRMGSVLLPLSSPVGARWFTVMVDSRDDVVESDETNNRGVASGSTAIPAVLTLQPASITLREGAALPGLASITRNGDRSLPLAVSLQSEDIAELQVPDRVLIPAGQASVSFPMQAIADGVVDGTRSVRVDATAPGFASAFLMVSVEDTDLPRLSLQLATNTVREGFTLPVTVTRDAGFASAMTVNVAGSDPGQLLPPMPITFGIGQSNATFALMALDDALVEGDRTYSITVSAPGHIGAGAEVKVIDDDLPTVTLGLSMESVGEGAGLQAVLVTVTRQPVSLRALELELASSHPELARIPHRLSIPAGSARATFHIGVTDNDQIDGPRSVQFRSWIRSDVSGIRLAEGGSASLTITDDDGPTLRVTLDRSMVGKGRNPAAMGWVSRNSGTNLPITVSLSSSDPGWVTVPPTVQMAAGVDGVEFPLTSIDNGLIDTNHTVVVSAEAAGFNPGSARVMVSDLDLPDLGVVSITAPTTAEAGAWVNLGYRLRNQGPARMISNTLIQQIHLSSDPVVGDDLLVGEYDFNGALPVDGEFGQSFSIRMPEQLGEYWVIVTVDSRNAVNEAAEDNNSRVSVAPIRVTAPYNAVVSTEPERAPAGTPVALSGRAFRPGNLPAPFVPVHIHVRVQGTRRVVVALTDANGNFALNWRPLAGEAGAYTVAAGHPGESEPASQDAFELFGLDAVPAALAMRVMEDETSTNRFELRNPGDLPLTGLSVTVLGAPASLDVAVSLDTNRIDGLGTTFLTTVIKTAPGGSGGQFRLRVTSAEGAVVEVPVSVEIRELQPRLVAVEGERVIGMRRGVQSLVGLRVVNVGGAGTGPVTVFLPDVPWLTLASPNPLPSVEPGVTNTLTLRLSPPDALPLGTYSGSVRLGAGRTSLVVPFEFRALSEAVGDLRIQVEDEFTYFAEGAPRLAQARVTVRDAVDGEWVAGGVTGVDGGLEVPRLAEGYYEIEVTADQHTAYRGTHLVRPGITNVVTPFLSRQSVRYSWTVVPTEIEDRYRIVVETVFEANVPAPVVTIEPSVIDLAEMPGDEWQVDLVISNHGLIAAEDFRLQFDSHPLYTMTPLVDSLGQLPARSSFTVPLTIRRVNGDSNGQRGGKAMVAEEDLVSGLTTASCSVSGRGIHAVKCGLIDTTQLTPLLFPNAIACDGLPRGSWRGGGGGGGGAGGGYTIYLDPLIDGLTDLVGIGGGRRVEPADVRTGISEVFLNLPTLSLPSVCDPCFQKRLMAAAACAWDFLPLPPPDTKKCLRSSLDCVKANVTSGLTVGSATGCASTLLDCSAFGKSLAKRIPGLGQLLTAIGCADGLCNACEGLPGHDGPCGLASPSPFQIGTRRGVGGLLSDGGPVPAVSAPRYSGIGESVVGPLLIQADRMQRILDPYRYFFGNDTWLRVADSDALEVLFAAVFESTLPGSAGAQSITEAERLALATLPLPAPLVAADLHAWLDRWNRTVTSYEAGVFRRDQAPPGSPDFFALDDWQAALESATAELQAYENEGVEDVLALWAASIRDLVEETSDSPDGNGGGGEVGVCARVRLRLEQEAVLTRDAFRASLEVENSTGSGLESVSVELWVEGLDGVRQDSLFGVRPPELDGVTGIGGDGHIAPGTTGRVSWTLIPGNEAAPGEPTGYRVGGTLSYLQDGLRITVPLVGSTITVLPSPRLVVRYFHERDVFGDDPFTEVIEPSIPFSLAVMVENQGAGAARNFRITSAQPQIVENEKGLLVDFRIIATEVEGMNLSPTLTADMGTVGPGTNAIARWLMTSTLQGLFTEYQATFAHLDELDGAKLSLIDRVEIHEMIRMVQAGGVFEDGRPDFLVNDVPDLRDEPDTLWLSDGSQHPVEVVREAFVVGTLSADNLRIRLDAALPGSWICLRVPDPGVGLYRLASVIRSDGLIIPMHTNAWVTDRTFRGLGKRPVEEHTLHLLDYNSTGSYTLVYEPMSAPDLVPPTSQVSALPQESRETFPVSWSGMDQPGDGAVARYDVFVSVDGGVFLPWLSSTTETAATYTGVLGRSYAFASVAIDAAGNREPWPGAPDAFTAVTLTNRAPVLAVVSDVIMNEGETLVLLLDATDPDGDRLNYRLLEAPPGLAISAGSGRLVWTTGEGHGPGTNRVTVRVEDDGTPSLGVIRSFLVTVTDVNEAPELEVISDRTLGEGQLLSFTAKASDTDLPAQSLRFSLGIGAPAGATLDPVSGGFSWRPDNTQGGRSYTIEVVVTDDGLPALSDARLFTVVVRDTRPDFSIGIGTTPLLAGDNGSVPFTLHAGMELDEVSFVVTVDGEGLLFPEVLDLAPELVSADFLPVDTNRFDVRFRTRPDASLQGDLPLARLGFGTLRDGQSRVVKLMGSGLIGVREPGSAPVNGAVTPGRVFILDQEPILDVASRDEGSLKLVLYARTGHGYALQRRGSLIGPMPWTTVSTVEALDLRTELLPVEIDPELDVEWFRAIRLAAEGLRVSVEDGTLVVEWSEDCDGCQLEQAIQPAGKAGWEPSKVVPVRKEGRFRAVFPAETGQLYFRLRTGVEK